ncbi:MAG: class I SAM-dependent methyltransferase [Anaerolineales bacterium]|jgi:ubiquinone/menaquinone biosynthesis C-methylase UbiE
MELSMWAFIPLLLFVIGITYWEIWVCEGAHLGRRFVIWLYDVAAGRYERIKQFDPIWEQRFLAEPVAKVLGTLPNALILDVGAGTGRLAYSLFKLPAINARVICLEPSKRMLTRGRSRTPSQSTRWIRGWAVPLPFPDDCFDILSSLEILEFTPHPLQTIEELARVLRPGGWLLITNRVGKEARWIFGKTFARERFPEILRDLGFENVEVFRWQVTYDLAWARKKS